MTDMRDCSTSSRFESFVMRFFNSRPRLQRRLLPNLERCVSVDDW